MIHNGGIEIPDLCPLYFGSVREPIFFYKQDNYIPKMISNTQLVIWINSDMYASTDEFKLHLTNGRVILHTFDFEKKILDGYDESIETDKEYYYIQTEIDIASFDNMIVSFEVWKGSEKLADTGAYEILPYYTDDLKVLTYTHRINDYNSLFFVEDTPINYSITIEGGFDANNFITEGRSKSFQNQMGYDTLLSALPIDKETFIIGDVYGIPNWLISIISRILCLSKVTIDGEEFSKFEDSEIERVNSQGGMAQYKIELQSKNTSTNKIFDNTHSYTFE